LQILFYGGGRRRSHVLRQHNIMGRSTQQVVLRFFEKDLQWGKKAKQHFGQFETETSFPDSPWNLNASINWYL
jgi:hypothetical protein